MRTTLVVSLAIGSVACGDRTSSPPADSSAAVVAPAEAALPAGEGRLAVDGGRIWYKVSGSGGGTPLILLHGGPGVNSYYLKPLEALGDARPVVRYDQLGSGKSDVLADTSKMRIAHFVQELDSLRARLGYDRVHLFGHSWGSILGVEYYRLHPERVASLVLASPALDIPEWERNARRLVKTLSDSAQRAIRVREADKQYDSPDYQAAIAEFYGKYVWLRPVEADLDSTTKQMNQQIFTHMQGPSEFTIIGTLKSYDARPFLREVKVPTLYLVGDVDEANPATVRRFGSITPGAKVVVIPNSAHIMTWDNPEATIAAVRTHLATVDSSRAP